jgi:hypothetical protein
MISKVRLYLYEPCVLANAFAQPLLRLVLLLGLDNWELCGIR